MSVNIAFSVGVMSAMYLTKGITGENSCRNFILFYLTSLRTCLFKKNIFFTSVSILLAGAHLNPAVTLSFCVLRQTPWKRLVPYSLSQLLGAYVASGVVYTVYYGWFLASFMMTCFCALYQPEPHALFKPHLSCCIKCYATIITCSFNHGSNAKKIHDLHAVPLWARGGYRPHVEIFLYLLTLCSRCYHVV